MRKLLYKCYFFLKYPFYILSKRVVNNGKINIKHVKLKVFKKGKMIVGSASFRNYGEIRVSENALLYIGDNVFFNNNINITCIQNISIGSNCKFGCNVTIVDHDHDYKNNIDNFIKAPIIIGENTWIGSNVVICKGVTIGKNVVVAAGSVVFKDIPSGKVFIQKRETK